MKVPPPPQQPGEGETVDGAGNKCARARGQRPSPGCGKRTIPAAWGNAFAKVGQAARRPWQAEGHGRHRANDAARRFGTRSRAATSTGGWREPSALSVQLTAHLAFDRFDPEEPRDKGGEWTDSGASAEPLKGSSGHPMLVSTRNVTAKKAEENSAESYTRPDLEALHRFPEQEKRRSPSSLPTARTILVCARERRASAPRSTG